MRRGIARSRSHAGELITGGQIRVGGIPTPKVATLVDAATPIEIAAMPDQYVSRGGLKLEAALEAFGIEVDGVRALDAGASTGGFTDCLLQHGAKEVVALDVGYGQLASRLREDPRVVVRERTNIRNTTSELFGGTFDLIVADLSFISLCTVAGALANLASSGTHLVALIKPQFEVGRTQVGKGGVVRSPELHQGAVDKVVQCLGKAGFTVRDVIDSPITGAKGNREFLAWAVAGIREGIT